MNKEAVGYAIGKLLQVMGLFLIVPMCIAIYDNFHLPAGDLLIDPEVFGFWVAILVAILAGTQMVAPAPKSFAP